jgi:signal transduction histidine kinase
MKTFFERRMQLQLLLILLAGLSVAGLSGLLIWDSVHNAESVVLDDMGSQLKAATGELARQGAYRVTSDSTWTSLPRSAQNISLRGITEAVLRSYPGVEGGFYENGEFAGYAFPTHDNPGAKTQVPDAERTVIESVVKNALHDGSAQQLLRGGGELVLICAARAPDDQDVTWAMQRRSHQNITAGRSALLTALVAAALVAVLGTLRMAIALRRGVNNIQVGLTTLERDFEYELPAERGELGEISRAINRMATSRRRLEEELRREDRLRAVGRTVAGIAHEIRNPLNGIRLSMQVLEQRLRKSAVQPDDLKIVIGEVDRMDALLGELLSFHDKKQLNLAEQSVVPCVERCIELAQGADAPTIRLVCDSNANLSAKVDGERLTQATLNLLLNAVEAAGTGGDVLVTIDRRASEVRIEVRDSGKGLNEEQQQNIFEAFYTTKANGTGLGLAVSRQLMRDMGGDLRFEPKGQGTVFVISVPAVQHG